jgi:DNA-binding CsgD family transcriptional regulator
MNPGRRTIEETKQLSAEIERLSNLRPPQSAQQIAWRLDVTKRTVERYRRRIRETAGAR